MSSVEISARGDVLDTSLRLSNFKETSLSVKLSSTKGSMMSTFSTYLDLKKVCGDGSFFFLDILCRILSVIALNEIDSTNSTFCNLGFIYAYLERKANNCNAHKTSSSFGITRPKWKVLGEYIGEYLPFRILEVQSQSLILYHDPSDMPSFSPQTSEKLLGATEVGFSNSSPISPVSLCKRNASFPRISRR